MRTPKNKCQCVWCHDPTANKQRICTPCLNKGRQPIKTVRRKLLHGDRLVSSLLRWTGVEIPPVVAKGIGWQKNSMRKKIVAS